MYKGRGEKKMHLIKKVVEYTGDPVFTIAFMGDTHIGCVSHDRNHWLRDIATIRDTENCFWIHDGDACECIVPTDPRWHGGGIDKCFHDRLDDLPSAQYEQFEKDVFDIRDKCLGLSEGNHDGEFQRRHYGKLTQKSAERLGVPFLSDTAMIRITFRRLDENGERNKSCVKTIFVQHGAGGGSKGGGKVNKMEDLPAAFEANIYVWGHVHRKMIWPGMILRIPESGKLHLVEKEVWYVLSGSYFKTYQEGHSSYGQRAAYRPVVLGCPSIQIRPMTGAIVGGY